MSAFAPNLSKEQLQHAEDLTGDLATEVIGSTEQRQLHLDLEAETAEDVQHLLQQDTSSLAPSNPPVAKQDTEPFEYDRSGFEKKVHVTVDTLLGKKNAAKAYSKALADQPARDAWKVRIMLRAVLAEPIVQRLARASGLPSLQSMCVYIYATQVVVDL